MQQDAVTQHQDVAARHLYRALSGESGRQNVLLSPFSIATVLALTHGGAAGSTAEQMKKALAIPDGDVELYHEGYLKLLKALQSPVGVTLKTANVVYMHSSFTVLDKYAALLKDKFLSEMKSVNFSDAAAASLTINSDISALTAGKITDLIDASSLNAATRLVLVNAVYFKGNWAKPFNPELTEKRDFFVSPGRAVKTDMMSMEETNFNVADMSDVGAKLLEMPYEGKRFKMVVLLPHDRDGLQGLERKLESTSLKDLKTPIRSQSCNVVFPKFKLEAQFGLVEALRKLGLVDLFDASAADLSGVTGDRSLYVSEAVHKAFIEVGEEGCEAAAATGVIMMMRCSLPSAPFSFVADHPFLFYIVDGQTGITVFSGRYTTPQ